MIRGITVRLSPTPEQERLFWKSAGAARWAYNYHIRRNREHYAECGEHLSDNVTRKEVTQLKKQEEYKWLNDVGSNVIKQAIKDANESYQRFFKKISGRPKFKSRDKSKPNFYVNYETLKKTSIGFRGEKIGNIKTLQPLPKLPKNQKHYSNPRISYDGKHWYLSVGIEIPENKQQLTSTVLGVDLGIKELAVCSDGTKYKNINKTKEVRRLEKKLKREQRKLSRMIEDKIIDYRIIKGYRHPMFVRPLDECSNIVKQKAKVKGIYKRLTDIRNNHLHQTTRAIVNTLPKAIVMEDLNVKGMLKNRHLAKSISQQKFYEFRRQIEYKAKEYGIDFRLVDRFYPSSKTCSCCGYVKKDLKLSDRTYVCPSCGNMIDRDLNASINLANCYINQTNLVNKRIKK